jgi:hypothetical protein
MRQYHVNYHVNLLVYVTFIILIIKQLNLIVVDMAMSRELLRQFI